MYLHNHPEAVLLWKILHSLFFDRWEVISGA